MRASAPAKINLALVVGPLRARRQARAAHRLPARRHRRPHRARAAAELRVDGFAGDTLVRDALEALAARAGVEPRWQRDDREAAPGRGRPRRRQLRRGDRAAPRERHARRAAAAGRAARRSPRRLGADVPFFLADGPQLGTGDGTSSRRSTSRRTSGSCSSLPHGAREAVDRVRLRRRSTRATAPPAGTSGATALLDALDARPAPARPRRAAAERPRVVAARGRAARARRVPRRRHRRRPGGLRALPPPGAPRRPRSARCKRAGESWLTAPAWYG